MNKRSVAVQYYRLIPGCPDFNELRQAWTVSSESYLITHGGLEDPNIDPIAIFGLGIPVVLVRDLFVPCRPAAVVDGDRWYVGGVGLEPVLETKMSGGTISLRQAGIILYGRSPVAPDLDDRALMKCFYELPFFTQPSNPTH